MTATTEPRTIDPADAEDLAYASDGAMAGVWCRETDLRGDSGRWMEHHTLVLRHDDGTVWGLDYAQGLTEYQDSDLPWRDAAGPIKLRRLYRTEQIVARYTTSPPADPAVPAVLVDTVYDTLYAALGDAGLILCPTTETGPANGIESGHVHDIAEQVVRVLRALEPARAEVAR
jgi:hypothetical protein